VQLPALTSEELERLHIALKTYDGALPMMGLASRPALDRLHLMHQSLLTAIAEAGSTAYRMMDL
jgi:hypothetical protein